MKKAAKKEDLDGFSGINSEKNKKKKKKIHGIQGRDLFLSIKTELLSMFWA